MKKITGLDFAIQNSSVSLGKFDGIHMGHRALLSEITEQKKLTPTVFTFAMEEETPKIYTQREKDLILEGLGIEREVIFPFHQETKNMTPEEFIDMVLVRRMDAKHICVGADFRFGKNRKGDVATLERYRERYGYTLEIVDKLKYENEIISSTRIRRLMEQGELATVNRLLGSPYFVAGTVQHGEQLGRTMHMPTANLVPAAGKILLPFGVYATTVSLEGKTYYGVTNIGAKPTVGNFKAGIETYIMDFQGEIYGKEIIIVFHEFLRKEQKFNDIGALKRQMEADKERAYRILTS